MSTDAAQMRHALAVTAAVLRQGERIDRLSRALTVLSLIGLAVLGTIQDAWPAMLLCAAALLAGLIELWFAMRAGIDAALFQDLAAAEDDPDWEALDAALVRLALMPAAKAGRPAAARIAGALRLPRCQAAALLAQCVSLTLAVWYR